MMKDWSDEKIIKWARFDVERSEEIIRQCKEFGYQYYDIADLGIDGVQSAAMSYLLAED